MTQPQILINQMNYNLSTGDILFNDLNLIFSQTKSGLIGRNGIGKSTLIKLILGEIYPHTGSIHVDGKLAYVPQNLFISPSMTIAGLLGYEEKIKAIQRIYQGGIDERDFIILNDEWDIEERLQKQLMMFGLNNFSFDHPLNLLSGGEVTRLLLVKAFNSDADFLLLDEPTNHLDGTARKQLYHAIQHWPRGLIIISHDRTLLNLLDEIIELTTLGASYYRGNFDDYLAQKEIEKNAKEQQLNDAKKLMQKNMATIQASREKHEKKRAYGKELRRSGSIDKMAAGSKKGRSERTQSKLLIKNERLIYQAKTQLQCAKEKIEIHDPIDVDLSATHVPNGKIILDIEHLYFSYLHLTNNLINDFNLQIQGPERIALTGDNGSGKTSLIKLILGELTPLQGKVYLGTHYISYLDQNASVLNPAMSVLDNFLRLNPDAKENDAYRCLAQFLFRNVSALKQVKELSGGEKLRAMLACTLMAKYPPQLLILDEPTNHLDLDSIKGIASALKNFQGAMIVVSHDEKFLNEIGVKKRVYAPFCK